MTARSALGVLTLAAALTMTGCSTAEQPASEASASTTATDSASSNADGTLSATQVEDLVRALVDGDESVEVVGNDVMQQQLQMAKDLDSSSGITPETCAKQMAEYTVTDLTGSVSATASSVSESRGKVIQVFSLTDDDTLSEISHALTLEDLDGCEQVTVEQDGEEISADRQILPLDVDAD